MKPENEAYIVENILPNDRDALNNYIRKQARMVLAKLCVLKDLDFETDKELIELEAMLLASTVQIGLIDDCFEMCRKEIEAK